MENIVIRIQFADYLAVGGCYTEDVIEGQDITKICANN